MMPQSPGSPPNTLFWTTVRTVSPGVLIIAPNTPAQNPVSEEDRQIQGYMREEMGREREMEGGSQMR